MSLIHAYVALLISSLGLLVTAAQIWRQRSALRRMRELAHRDDTTGLPNRRALLAAILHAQRNRHPIGVVVLDLDKFKTINDTFGHEGGNQVLAAVGRRLAALTHPVALAARLSGDEFALLVVGDSEQVEAAASAAWRAISRDPIAVWDRYVTVTASVGHVTALTAATPAELLRAADMAMYEAKQARCGVRAATTRGVRLPRHRRYRDQPRP